MELDLFQVDAFTNEVFGGNPAGVVYLSEWLPDELLLKIAMENNLSETAYIVKKDNNFHIRWFTPKTEVDLCGHATLASSYVLKYYYNYPEKTLTFKSKSGPLKILFESDYISMFFPTRPPYNTKIPENLIKGLGVKPVNVLKSERDYLVEVESEEIVRSIKPDMRLISIPDSLGVIVTAKGDDVDFVSRFFAPNVGIPEDPVTGSSHTTLVPYWREKLRKDKFIARQLSERGGELICEYLGDKVKISGKAVLYLKGKINIPIQ
jgi:PhzF family phenazine biosynthesis protein